MRTAEKPVVLMLDDHGDTLLLAKEAFEGVHGHEFVGVSTVEEAMKALHDATGNVVAFVDIHISGSKKNGFDLLTYIQQNLPFKVVPYAYTGDTSLTVEIKALRAGAINVFHKTVDPLDRLVAYAEESLVGRILKKAVLDELTHVSRFSFFQHQAITGMKTARERKDDKHPSEFSLLVINPKDMKNVNNTHGILEGDKVLGMIARIVKGNVRPSDPICRKSGDKFLIWLPGVDRGTALDIGEKISRWVCTTPVKTDCGSEIFMEIEYAATHLSREDISEDEAQQLDQLIGEVYRELS